MSKASISLTTLPAAASRALLTLGEHLALGRVRRGQSQREWAQRLGVSVPTLIRLERGDPSVSMAAYATALWLLGQHTGLAELAAPERDTGALELDIRAAQRTRAVRAQASATARAAASETTKATAKVAAKSAGKAESKTAANTASKTLTPAQS